MNLTDRADEELGSCYFELYGSGLDPVSVAYTANALPAPVSKISDDFEFSHATADSMCNILNSPWEPVSSSSYSFAFG